MKWLEKIRHLIAITFHDLVAEGEIAEHDPLVEQLEVAEAQLVALQHDCAEATARQKRLEMEWQAGFELLQSLNEQVDTALQAGADETAQQHLEQVRWFESRVEHLAELAQRWGEVTAKLQVNLRTQRAHLDELRRRRQALAESEQGTEMLERLQTLQREMRLAGRLHSQLGEQEEQVAQRNDRLAAREELSESQRMTPSQTLPHRGD